MKLRKLMLGAAAAAMGVSALLAPVSSAQAEETQFFPSLVYRTGAYAPNGIPFANGYSDYYRLVNERGGINGVKIPLKSARQATQPTVLLSAMSA